MKTLVIGASLKPMRYSNQCLEELAERGIETIAIGLREGTVSGILIRKDLPEEADIHTVSIYLGPNNQPTYYDYILRLRPKRVIFNPGTSNPDFQEMLAGEDIEVIEDCTLLMLRRGDF